MRRITTALLLAAVCAAPAAAQQIYGGSFLPNQVAVGTTATPIVGYRPGRIALTLTVTTAVQCSFGGPGVTLATGFPLQAVAGASVTFQTGAAVYGVCASAATVGEAESF